MRQGVTVTYPDGTVIEGEAAPAQVIEFERKYDLAWGSDLRTEYVYYLAYLAMKRAFKRGEHGAAVLPGSFEAFVDLEPDVKLRKASDPKVGSSSTTSSG